MDEEEIKFYLKGLDGNVLPFCPEERKKIKAIQHTLDQEALQGAFTISIPDDDTQ